ncbi:hypothetical protein Tco_1423467, partial [Tanacetum coccineum]
SSSKSAINDVQKDKNVSSSPALKTWDCINEFDTDDEDVIPSYGSSLGGGNQIEDKDFDFSDGYEDQVVDFPGQLKEFRDFKLSMCGFCVLVALLCRTEYMLADMFMKAMSQDRFEYLVRRLGMRCLTLAELEVLAKETA